MKYYDSNGDGHISYNEFVAGLRDELNDRLKNIVSRAFDQISGGSGTASVEDLKNSFDVSSNPDFTSGARTRDDIVQEFLDSFSETSKGSVTKQDFINYYTDVHLSCPTDEYFIRMMQAVWNVTEDDDAAIYKEQLAFFISQVRLRVLEMSNHNLEEFVLRKIFNHFDANKSGTLTLDELQAMVSQLKLTCE